MAGTVVCNTINTDTGLFSTNNAYSGIAKAWINFSATGGTITIKQSFNVTSVTYNSTGSYTVNFTTAMSANTFVSCVTSGTQGTSYGVVQLGTQTTSSLTFGSYDPHSDAGVNNANNAVAIFSA
jgi:hypothetical protein